MPRSIIRTITTAIAIAALAAPTALARPADTPPAVAKAAAATSHKQARLASAANEYPSRPAQGEQANPRPETAPQPAADSGIAWSMIGLGIAGLLAAAAIAGIVGRTRHAARARITA